MQLAVAFVILVTVTPAWAKRINPCEFKSNFAEAYARARTNLLSTTLKNREQGRPAVNGVFRRRESGGNWGTHSLDRVVRDFFQGEAVDIHVQTNGKMFIYPQGLPVGQESPMIVFDPSGDYFRITTGRLKVNGSVDDKRRYLLRDGSYVPLPLPAGWTQERWLRETHFVAVP